MKTWTMVWLLAVAAAGCEAQPGTCDGVIGIGESCDDGNDDPFDGCDCTAEPEWTPPLGERGNDGFVVVEDDGAWCWFQDERAVFVGSRLVASSVSHAGDIQVSSFDLTTHERDHGMLRRRFERDDHDAASLLVRPDGKLMAFYTRHDGFPSMHWRTQVGEDLSTWSGERTFTIDDDITYSNPFLLNEEGGDEPRLQLWFRGLGYSPTVSSSDDLGSTWSTPTQVLESRTVGLAGRTEQRPYVKYASNGTDTIHLIYTEGHPAEFEGTSLYHLTYSHGALRRSDGTVVGTTAGDKDPKLSPSKGTQIHDGALGSAWGWDLELDRDGSPIVVYSVHVPSDDGALEAHYRYARWDGERWIAHDVAFAGSALYRDQRYYTGGITLDPADPTTVYFSTNVEPSTGAAIGTHHELYRGVTRDGGASWAITQVTRDSTVDNLRPVVPKNHPTATAVVWMQGTYQSYIDFDTRIVALLGGADAVVAPAASAAVPASVARLPVSMNGATGGKATLEVSNVEGQLATAGDSDMERVIFYRKGTSSDRAGRLAATIGGLAPMTPYTVRVHTYLPTTFALAPMVWMHDGAGMDDNGCSMRGIAGAHRPGNNASGADSYVDLDLTSDAKGTIDLVGVALDDRKAHGVVALGGVEVFARPTTVPAEGVTVTVTSDRPQRSGETATVGRDRLVVDLDGLRPGARYAITVHTEAMSSCDRAASRWQVDEAGRLPRVVRSFELAGGSFVFTHVAAGTQLRLSASDVYYRFSTSPSEIALAGIEVAEVVP